MDQQQSFTPPSDFPKGWALAYDTQDSGPVQVGVLGRLAARDGGVAHLKDAITFHSVEQPSPHGGVVRTCHGTPLEFTASLREVFVSFARLIPLDSLAASEREVYVQALREAAAAEGSLRQTKGQDLVKPVQTPALIGPGGSPLR